MGIDFHALSFLAMLANEAPFGATLTLGRQRIQVSRRGLDAAVGPGTAIATPGWSEPLWRRLGAASVQAIDASNYEGAEIVHDLTRPVVSELHGAFDTVFDGGTLQHVVDPVAVLSNCRDLCRVGGRVVHIVPANNFCGFGFYQFSPELFQTFYQASGFAGCRVLLAKLADRRTWFAYELPEGMLKPTLKSRGEVYLLVVATKTSVAASQPDELVQHEYTVKWSKPQDLTFRPPPKPSLAKRASMQLQRIRFFEARDTIGARNPALRPVRIADALRGVIS